MVGFAPKTINLSISNYSSNGYYFYVYNGSLYGTGTSGGTGFASGGDSQGTEYGFQYNGKKGEITIWKNGQKLGIAFKNIKKIKITSCS